MENKEQSYEDFISTVSHELRTPLTSIKGFSQTMLSSWDKIDDESKKKFVKIIEQQAQRLINLVENMLAVTKLQKTNSLIYIEFDLKKIIEQITLILKNQYPQQIYKCQYQQNLPMMFADKDKFQQIMTNLLENSAKYSVDSNTTEIKAYTTENNIVIEISNTGIFIDKKDYSKIFEKFSRIDNPLTRKVQGSGLGLYITKNIAEKMGGEIRVASEQIPKSDLGKITFTIQMPIRTIEEQARLKCSQ